jgi:hypothetical protein
LFVPSVPATIYSKFRPLRGEAFTLRIIMVQGALVIAEVYDSTKLTLLVNGTMSTPSNSRLNPQRLFVEAGLGELL